MKTTLVVLFILFLALAIFYRQRIYVRDPLATVYRDDVQQSDAQVFINYTNDVLLEQNDFTGVHTTLVQDWNRKPGTPQHLTCLRWMACITEADRASTIPLPWTGKSAPPANEPARSGNKGQYDPKVFMTGHEVTFVDGIGSAIRIELR